MRSVDVLAVVGTCAPERAGFATRLAGGAKRALLPAASLEKAADPLDAAVSTVRYGSWQTGVVVEFPTATVVTDLVGTLVGDGLLLTDVVCVADAAHLLADLWCEDYAVQPPPGRWGTYLATAKLTVGQLELASTIVLVNWAALPTPALATVMGLVSHLNPAAHIWPDPGEGIPPLAGAPYAVEQGRPGWVALLNDEFRPRFTDTRVGALRYEGIRPFHPDRLQTLLDHRIEQGEFGAVIRSSGFCRFATRPNVVAQWDHVGAMISFEPIGFDDDPGRELLSVGQDLAFIGIDLDDEALAVALDEAALSDGELLAGVAAWREYPDPFPQWPTARRRPSR
ncbi:GTP-binding protein [Gordonia sp. X0973]|uniref:GTP-binding protein n=1 Tax=Gordonia sp. X0973 TaxID=2742602 RepID=UPI000F549C18|nr:GTP-binding protein [Gordonia sp. X0973]QKT06599.1 GTP-binding protein [Gordonia sp. X0973]